MYNGSWKDKIESDYEILKDKQKTKFYIMELMENH